jgi:6-phosphogluconate dehydrogenase
MQKELIFIGLGRMGLAMTTHLVEEGYIVYGHDLSDDARAQAAVVGVKPYETLDTVMSAMSGRKVLWLMVPSSTVDIVLDEVVKYLLPGDIIVDGGNSFYKDTLRRGAALQEQQIHYVDCGTSGGMKGARHGASLMVGGDKEVVTEIEQVFTALATPEGYAHVGGIGAGHFVKMVHNGIEYGMMGALAEGMNFVEAHGTKLGVDVHAVLNPYQHGSIISSALMDWLADSYRTEGYLDTIAGEVPRGETEIEMEHIVAQGETPVLEAAIAQRKMTRGTPSRIGVLISAMRNQFGGHAVMKRDKTDR